MFLTNTVIECTLRTMASLMFIVLGELLLCFLYGKMLDNRKFKDGRMIMLINDSLFFFFVAIPAVLI